MLKKHSVKKCLLVILCAFICLLLISFVFPIKFCVGEYPEASDKDFYVVRFDETKNWWLLTGDKGGLDDWNTISDFPVTIEGENIEEIVSGDLYLNYMPTYFILWGEMDVKEQYDEKYGVIFKEYVINCTKWDILGEVHSRNEFRNLFSRKYLTVYDYHWFDTFRKTFWYYDFD